MKRLATGLAALVVILLGAAQGSAGDDKADPADEKAIRERRFQTSMQHVRLTACPH
jgi:hypothetical protein